MWLRPKHHKQYSLTLEFKTRQKVLNSSQQQNQLHTRSRLTKIKSRMRLLYCSKNPAKNRHLKWWITSKNRQSDRNRLAAISNPKTRAHLYRAPSRTKAHKLWSSLLLRRACSQKLRMPWKIPRQKTRSLRIKITRIKIVKASIDTWWVRTMQSAKPLSLIAWPHQMPHPTALKVTQDQVRHSSQASMKTLSTWKMSKRSSSKCVTSLTR